MGKSHPSRMARRDAILSSSGCIYGLFATAVAGARVCLIETITDLGNGRHSLPVSLIRQER